MSESRANVLRARGVSAEPRELLDESRFRQMLCRERKRAERSSRRFILMLLGAGPLFHGNGNSQVLSTVLHALTDAFRDTDVKGWYEGGTVLGVIFTEIGDADGRAVTKALLSRTTQALSSALRIEDINSIQISFHVFPEVGVGNSDSPLYPDLTWDFSQEGD